MPHQTYSCHVMPRASRLSSAHKIVCLGRSASRPSAGTAPQQANVICHDEPCVKPKRAKKGNDGLVATRRQGGCTVRAEVTCAESGEALVNEVTGHVGAQPTTGTRAFALCLRCAA